MEGIGPSPRDSTTYDQEMEGERVLVLSIFSVVWPRHTAWVSSICCLQACPTPVRSMADSGLEFQWERCDVPSKTLTAAAVYFQHGVLDRGGGTDEALRRRHCP